MHCNKKLLIEIDDQRQLRYIDSYFNKEVKPYLNHSWMDRSKDKVGYEINFTKYFYEFENLRSV